MVVDTSGPLWNLPEGDRYERGAEYPQIPVYARTTICVDRWLRNAGFPENHVVVVTVGGSIESTLSVEEAREINEEQESHVVDAGDVSTLHEASIDPVFTEGDRVALLVEHSEYRSFDGMRPAGRTWGGLFGAFVVRADGRLENEPLDRSFPDVEYPKTLDAFERAVSSPG